MTEAKTHYRPNLRDILPANTPKKESILLNKHFLPWRKHIAYYLKNRDLEKIAADHRSSLITKRDILRYRENPWKELYEECQRHAEEHNKTELNSEAVLVLVHPLYLFLTHWNALKNEQMSEAERYLQTFKRVIKDTPSAKLAKVVLDTTDHYAAATSSLLEEGLIDQVILTEFDTGRVMDKKKLKKLSDREVYVSGGYNHHCLSSSLGEIVAEIGEEKVRVVGDLVLSSPGDGMVPLVNPGGISLKLEIGIDLYLTSNKKISLDDLLKKFS